MTEFENYPRKTLHFGDGDSDDTIVVDVSDVSWEGGRAAGPVFWFRPGDHDGEDAP